MLQIPTYSPWKGWYAADSHFSLWKGRYLADSHLLPVEEMVSCRFSLSPCGREGFLQVLTFSLWKGWYSAYSHSGAIQLRILAEEYASNISTGLHLAVPQYITWIHNIQHKVHHMLTAEHRIHRASPAFHSAQVIASVNIRVHQHASSLE
jgi:hypothetical protein